MRIGSSSSSLTRNDIDVMLDGLPIGIPVSRRSLTAIHSYLETIALEKQRILCALTVDGKPANLSQALTSKGSFSRVQAETIGLDDMPMQILKTARQQIAGVRDKVEAAVPLVLINDGVLAREFWWELTRRLKEPLLTLSLLPDNACGPENGRASLSQLRKWQLQQLANIIQDVDESCQNEDTLALSNALENRVLRWLDQLQDLVTLWHETVSANARLAAAAPA
jgi:hypothetical protein